MTLMPFCNCFKLNAMANRAAGKGYENEDHYTNIKLQFIGIENIHVMRNSQQKLIDGRWTNNTNVLDFIEKLFVVTSLSFIHAVADLMSPSMSEFLWGLESSGWLKHIKAVLESGVFIAKVGLFRKTFKLTLLLKNV